MSSAIYPSIQYDMSRGLINFTADTFYAMLVTDAYAFSKTHTRRNHITGEVSGAGYTSGGVEVACAITFDGVAGKTIYTFSNILFPAVTITARGLVIYKHHGGAASGDELVQYIDFGSNQSCTAKDMVMSFNDAMQIAL